MKKSARVFWRGGALLRPRTAPKLGCAVALMVMLRNRAKGFSFVLWCGICAASSLQAQLFSDSFSGTNLSPWVVQSGNWAVTNGALRGGINPADSYGFAFITNLFADFSAQAQFQFPVGAYGGGLGGRLNPATGSHYALWIYPENSAGGSKELKLLRFDSYSSFVVLQTANLAAVGTNFHTATLEFSGSLINAYFDTNLLLSATDATYPSGSISLDFWTAATGYQMTVSNVAVYALPSATVTVNGALTYQTIDGFGVNANHRNWTNNELVPVLDALINQAGMTLFRVVYDNADWETNNENPGPIVTNWPYFSMVYSNTPDFQALWGIMAYLNQKGITNGLMPNFQGLGPAWMGGESLTPGYENQWAEMIASALVYARYTNHLQFTLVGPNNEPDIPGSGIGTTAAQYVTTLHDLSQQLDTNGMKDVRFVGPDLSSSGTNWLPNLMSDPVVMGKLGHFGLHSYSGGGAWSTGVYDYLQQSAYPDITFWMTEFNVWCQVCQTGGAGTNNWDYFRGTAEYLLADLANGSSAGLVWEGYDSIYRNNYNDAEHWTFWGLFAVNDTNAVPKTYTARPNFYTLSQITAFVRPGAQRIDVSGSVSLEYLLAFYNTNNGQLTLTGVNDTSSASSLSCALTSLPVIPSLDFYYTSSTTNLCYGGSVAVNNGAFSVVVPADCVFTLTYTNHAPSLSPVSVAPLDAGQTITITNHASDPDSPPQTLSFALLTAPAGATLNTNTGVFTWRAPAALANTTNPVALTVTDNGYPPLSATQSFSLVVNPLTPPTLRAPAFSNGLPTLKTLGPIGPDYLLQRSSNLTTWSTIFTTTPLISPFILTDTNTPLLPAAFYRIRLSP